MWKLVLGVGRALHQATGNKGSAKGDRCMAKTHPPLDDSNLRQCCSDTSGIDCNTTTKSNRGARRSKTQDKKEHIRKTN